MSVTMDRRVRAQPRGESMYFGMAVLCAAIAFAGFAPTYWMPVTQGRFAGNPIVHVHGVVFSAWSLFLVYQTWLATSGHVMRHRRMGLVGVAFATAMTIFGVLAGVNMMRLGVASGQAEAARAFGFVPLSSIAFFAVVVTIAIVRAREREVHKRLMLLASVSIVDAAIARMFFVLLAPPGAPGTIPPVMADVGPGLVTCALLLIPMAQDWRLHGRPHAAYVWGGLSLLALKLLQVPIAASAAWQAAAGEILAIAG
ncbi:MAG: hypothetical protein J0H67_21625 [Rhodospirillales bacterium]|nr:hypothetical protein [Rhodospirillales bacterium]